MKFRPLHDRVLVRRLEQEARSAGGIIIPDTAQEKPMEGEIVATGNGTRTEDGKTIPLDVKAGDQDHRTQPSLLAAIDDEFEAAAIGQDLVEHNQIGWRA